jgi:hypothetical protein
MRAFILDASSGRIRDEYGPTLQNENTSEENLEECIIKAMGNMTPEEKRHAICFPSERPESVSLGAETC